MEIRERIFFLALTLFFCVSIQRAFAEPNVQYQGSYPIVAVATTGMISDLVQQIGGKKIKVETIMGPGVDPHLYKPAPRDLSLLLSADIVFANGLHLEGRMVDILEKYSKKKTVVLLGEHLDRKLLRQSQDFAGGDDPHIWMDVGLWLKVADIIASSLAQFDPPNATLYNNNLQSVSNNLVALNLQAQRWIASIPPETRVLVTAHDAFFYFGRAYNIEVRGIQGISTESEAGLRDINSLVDFLVQRKIPAVFVESSVPQKNVQALVEGARARGHEISIGGELFSDSMGGPGTKEGTYVGMIEHNLRVITNGLGGKVSEVTQ